MVTRILAVSIVTVLPGISLAACPVAEDLNAGIRVLFEDETSIEYSRREPGVIVEAEKDPEDGSLFYIVTERGILEVENYARANRTAPISDLVRYEYDFDTTSVFPLVPGKNGSGKMTGYDENGAELEQAHVTYGIGVGEVFRAGDCEMDALSVQINMKFDGSSPIVVQLAYLPDLDFAVVKSFYELGDDVVTYVPTAIETMRKK